MATSSLLDLGSAPGQGGWLHALARPPRLCLLGARLCPDPSRGGVAAVSKDGRRDRAATPAWGTPGGDHPALCASAGSEGGRGR